MTARTRRAAAWLLPVLLLTSAAAARAQELARLFPLEADVHAGAPGLVRLQLPAEVLGQCTPELSDLRLFDRAGHEVPYLVDPGVPAGLDRRQRVVAGGRVTDLTREEMPREGGKAATLETYRVALPTQEAPLGGWTLVVTSAQPRFVRSVEVRGVARAGDGRDVVLVPRASLVQLGQPLVDRTRIPLPPFDGDEVVLSISGEEGFFLEPVLRFEGARTLAAADLVEQPLAVLAQRRAGGRTVLDLERPPGLVASRLRLASTTPAFDRAVEVFDVAADGTSTRIGSGRVLRAPAASGEPLGEQLDVVVARAHGPRLRVEVADGDSPPLADLRVVVAFSPPALLFALPPAVPGEPAGVLRFGGNRAYAPRYDVADLFQDAFAASGAVLAEPGRVPAATLGAVRANPHFDPQPALAPVMRAGAALDVDQWGWHRSVTVPASPEGLTAVRLAPDDVAHALPGLGDLRFVDGAGRQWPFVVVPAAQRETLLVKHDGPRSEGGRSRWTLELADAPLSLDRLVVHTAHPALERRYRILAPADDGAERVLGGGVLAQDLRRPAPLTLSFQPARVERLALEVEDGDDAPLDLTRVEAPVALPALLVAAPPGAYTLLAGNPDAAPPSYDIERARDVVRGLRAAPAAAGEGVANARWRGTPGGSTLRRERLQNAAIWAAIVLAVLVLGALTLRAARGGAADNR